MAVDPNISQHIGAQGLAQMGGEVDAGATTKKSKDSTKSTSFESAIEQLTDGDSGTDVTAGNLKQFMQKAGQRGYQFQQNKLQKQVDRGLQEYIKDYSQTEESANDNVELQTPDKTAPGDQAGGKTIGSKIGLFKRQLTQQQSSVVKEYTALYSRALSGSTLEAQAQLTETEKQMRESGFSQRDLLDIKGKLKGAVRKQVIQMAKDAQTQEQLTKGDSWAFAQSKHAQSSVLREARRWAGANADDKDSLQKDTVTSCIQESTKDSMNDLKSFVYEAFRDGVFKKALTGEGLGSEKFDKLMELGKKCGFNIIDYMEGIELEQIHLGLMSQNLDKVKELRNVDIVDNKDLPSDGGGSNDRKKEQEEQDAETKEIEALQDELRAIFLQRKLKPGFRTMLSTEIRIRQINQRLKELGVWSSGMEQRIKAEAEFLGRMRMVDMLKEAFLERATFKSLKGGTAKRNQERIERLVAMARDMGEKISKKDIHQYIDEANRQSFDLIKREIDLIDARLEGMPDESLKKRREDLLEVMLRIKEESEIPDVMPGELSAMGQRVVTESA